MKTEKTITQTIFELIGYLVAIFLSPWLVMKGWDAIAGKFDLPQLSYWACFFVSHGFRYLTGSFRKK